MGAKDLGFAWMTAALIFLVMFSAHTVEAEQGTTAKGSWVLKESQSQSFKCEISDFCSNPTATAGDSAIDLGWGSKIGGCNAAYKSAFTWSNVPDVLVPGETMSSHVELSATQVTDCPTSIDANIASSLMVGKSTLPGEWSGSWDLVKTIEIRGRLKYNENLAKSEDFTWTVPQGSSDEELHVKFSSALSSLPGADKTFIYEYEGLRIAKQAEKEKPKPKLLSCSAFFPKEAGGAVKSSELGSGKLLDFISLIPAAAARDSGARFADFTGEVTVAPGSDPKDEQPAEMDMVLAVGSIIKTEGESSAIISFADMTTFCMKPFTTVILDTPPEKYSKLSFLAGKVLANVNQMIKDGTMNVTMNQAVAGIKATTLILEEKQGESILKVVDGTVEFTSKATGESVLVNTGEMAVADGAGVRKSVFDIAEESKDWSDLSGTAGQTEGEPSGFGMWIMAGILVAIIAAGSYFFLGKRIK